MPAIHMKPLLAITMASAVGLSAISCPAAAADRPTVRELQFSYNRVVRYYDLNLSKMTDAMTLHKRITHAAKIVCADVVGVRIISLHRAYDKCVEIAIDRAVDQVGNINLTEVHEGHGVTLASQ